VENFLKVKLWPKMDGKEFGIPKKDGATKYQKMGEYYLGI